MNVYYNINEIEIGEFHLCEVIDSDQSLSHYIKMKSYERQTRKRVIYLI